MGMFPEESVRLIRKENWYKLWKEHRLKSGKTGIVFTEDKGQTWEELDGETLVSMNMWGFTESILQEIKKRISCFSGKRSSRKSYEM